jgi:Ni/Co efflux regulator RcnB
MKILALAAGIALALGGIASSVPASAQGVQDNGRHSGYNRGHDRGGKWNNHSNKRYGNDRRYRNHRDDRRWRNHGRRCWNEWRHHRNIRVCR